MSAPNDGVATVQHQYKSSDLNGNYEHHLDCHLIDFGDPQAHNTPINWLQITVFVLTSFKAFLMEQNLNRMMLIRHHKTWVVIPDLHKRWSSVGEFVGSLCVAPGNGRRGPDWLLFKLKPRSDQLWFEMLERRVDTAVRVGEHRVPACCRQSRSVRLGVPRCRQPRPIGLCNDTE